MVCNYFKIYLKLNVREIEMQPPCTVCVRLLCYNATKYRVRVHPKDKEGSALLKTRKILAMFMAICLTLSCLTGFACAQTVAEEGEADDNGIAIIAADPEGSDDGVSANDGAEPTDVGNAVPADPDNTGNDDANVDGTDGAAAAIDEEKTEVGNDGTDSADIIAPTDPVPVLKIYQFVVDGVIVSTQVVKTGDTLYAPASPEKEGYKFVGWHVGGAAFSGFGVQTVTDAQTVTVEAAFEQVHYVFFLDNKGRVYATREGLDGTVISADVSFPVGVEEAITGWYTDAALTNKVSSVTISGADITLYPKVETGSWITFDTLGGSYIAPQFVEPGSKTVAPADPTKPGYTFAGWTADGASFSFGSELNASVLLVANWTANTKTPFTVNYWTENANDKDYSFAGQYKGSAVGTTDAKPELSSAITATSNLTNGAYFTYDAAKTAAELETVTIAGDGSTIVNVYFSRNSYSVTFDLGRDGNKAMTVNGTTYKGGWNAAKYTLTAKFEAKIENLWPTASNFEAGDGFYGWDVTGISSKLVSKRLTMTADLCATNGKTATADYGTDCLDHLYYMFESLDQTSPANGNERILYNGTYYDRSAAYSQDANSTGGNWNAKTISGMTSVGVQHTILQRTILGPTERNVFLYYKRNSYTLTLYNFNAAYATYTVKFGASISDKNVTLTAENRPAELTDGYGFQGWYTTEECVQAFDWSNATMPAGDLIVYAKWGTDVYTVTVYLNPNGTGEPTVIKVPYGEKIDQSQLPAKNTPDGYEWIGWATKDANGSFRVFNLNTAIYQDYTLYSYYISTDKFTVSYVANGGTGDLPLDERLYAEDSYAEVLSGGNLVGPDGKAFLGWQSSADGRTYQPKDKMKMPAANVTMTAVWGEKPAAATIVFHSNMGDSAVKSFDMDNNAVITAPDAADIDFVYAGYAFTGWGTSADSGVVYPVGSSLLIDNNSANHLYANWKRIAFNVTYSYTGDVPVSAPALPADARVNSGDAYTVAAVPTLDGYTFDGWYKGAEKVTSFTMPAENVQLTGSWKIRTDLSYTVNYLEQGTNAVLAPAKTVGNQIFGAEVTEQAIDIEGYNKVAPTSATITIAVQGNEITFYYTKRADLSYTVNYLEKDTGKVLAPSKTVGNQTYGSVVVGKKIAIWIDNYDFDSADPEMLTIGVDEAANVINLYYVVDEDDDEVPKTGDDSKAAPVAFAMLICLAGAILLIRRERRFDK